MQTLTSRSSIVADQFGEGFLCRPSRHRPASLRCRGSAIASVTGIMMRCCVRRRSSDPPGIRPDGASSHRMGECQRAVCRSRRHVSLRGHFVCRRPRNSCGKPQSVRHSWPAARRTPEYPAVGPTRRRGQNGNMALDLTAYFDRINYRGATDPTLDVLQDLVTVHSRTIPFENLDPLLGCRSTTSVHRRWPTSWYFGAEAGTALSTTG